MPQFTQSYVIVACPGQKNRTPNAAQKDQHKPVWNATIRIPISLPTNNSLRRQEEDYDAAADEDDEGSNSDSDSSEDDQLTIEVFVQEMQDSYTSYGLGRLSLLSLCTTTPSSNPCPAPSASSVPASSPPHADTPNESGKKPQPIPGQKT